MSQILDRSLLLSLGLAVAGAMLAGGCQPAAPTAAPVGMKGPAAPPPPRGAAASAQSPSAAATASGLPPELLKQIDVLIQSHKDYVAAAEQVRDSLAAKDRMDQFSELTQRGSSAYEDVMIGYGKLSADQKIKFETYMNEHVLPINNLRRQHQERLEGLLVQ